MDESSDLATALDRLDIGDSPATSILGGAPSSTALRVAALRALHQTVDVPPVFIDPLAVRILGSGATELLDKFRATAHETAHLRATLAARGVFASIAIAEAIERGVRQCVILGAGLDTFAYRHTYPGLRVFEVDHPKGRAWKRDVLRCAKINPPSALAYVGVDFERDDLFASLNATGFDSAQPAIFVMLGVSFYLVRKTLLGLVGRIGAECACGTELVFDYSEPLDRAPEDAWARYRMAASRVAAAGEPWISFFTASDIDFVLRRSGFKTVLDLDAAAQNAHWFAGRTDSLAVAPLAHLVRACTTRFSTEQR